MKTLISTAIVMFFCLSLMAQSPAVPLKLTLEKGKIYKLKNVSNQTIQRAANGMDMTIKIYSNIVTNFKVLSQENDIMSIEIKFDTIENKTSYPGGKKEMNFAKPAKKNEYFERVMNKFCDIKITAKISTSGKFMSFVDYNTFKVTMETAIDSVPATQKNQVQMQAGAYMKESALQSLIEPLFAYLPEKNVTQGDKWETSYTLASPQLSMLMFNNYTLNSIENNMAKVSGTSEIELMPSNEPVQPGAPQMSKEVKGTVSSNLAVELSTGLVSKGTTKGHADITITVKTQGNENKTTMGVETQSEISRIQ